MKIKRYEQYINERVNGRMWRNLERNDRIKYLINLGMSKKEAEEVESPSIYDLPDDIVDYVQVDFN